MSIHAKACAGLLLLAMSMASCAHAPEGVPEKTSAIKEAVPRNAAVADGLNENTYFAMGNSSLKVKRLKEAEAYFLKAIGLNPGRPEFYNNLAWTYMEDGDYKSAEENIKKAISLDRERPYIYLDTYGVIIMRTGKTDDAEEMLLKALALAGEDDKKAQAHILSHLLELYARSGAGVKAKEIEQRLRGF